MLKKIMKETYKENLKNILVIKNDQIPVFNHTK